MALNANIDLQFAVAKNVLLFTSLGFHAQPVGGNGDFDFTYAPLFYLVLGVGFGNF